MNLSLFICLQSHYQRAWVLGGGEEKAWRAQTILKGFGWAVHLGLIMALIVELCSLHIIQRPQVSVIPTPNTTKYSSSGHTCTCT